MTSIDLSKCKVMIIEDSVFMSKLLESMLISFNVKKVKCVSALEMISGGFVDFNPDLILTDWAMPDRNGDHVVEFVRGDNGQGNRFTPIIVISGYTDTVRVKEMLSTGVDDVIVKPVASEILYQRICNLIQNPHEYVEGVGYLGPKRYVKYRD